MRIKCPYCGERALEEFTYRGDATVKRPESLEPSASGTPGSTTSISATIRPASTRSIGTTAPAAILGSW